MGEKRIVGIDFGTSTSVVKTKNYTVSGGEETWQSQEQDVTATRSVTFNNGAVMVPTLVQKVGDKAVYYGYDAAMSKKGETLFKDFKVALDGKDAQEARALTQGFLGYLFDTYRQQRDGGFLGSPAAEEKTLVSYPVKWSREARAFMVQAAEKAGFKNVEGMDEAQAAIQAVTILSRETLERKRYLLPGQPVNIMLMDMGAGTTDIVICRYTPGRPPKNEILCVWPREGDILFGGRELDGILKNYILEKVPLEDRPMFSRFINDMEYKKWKEANVSGALGRNEAVTTFEYGEFILSQLDAELAPFTLDRREFERYAGAYLRKLPVLVNESIRQCVRKGSLTGGNDIHLVILTGGHSQWYFVKDALRGVPLAGGEPISLGRIQKDPERIIEIARPQETVALGLTYSKLPMGLRPAEPAEPVEEPTEEKTRQEKILQCPSCRRRFGEGSLVEEDGEYRCPHCGFGIRTAIGGSAKKTKTKKKNQTKREETGATQVVPAPRPAFSGPLQDRYVPEEECLLEEEPPRTGETWETFLQTVVRFFAARGHDYFAEPTNDLLTLRRRLGIPDTSNVLFYHDTSWFKRGANGFAVCREGLYCLEAFTSTQWHASWFAFLASDLVRDGLKIWADNRLVAAEAVDGVFKIYQSLQQLLRTTDYYQEILRRLETSYSQSVRFREKMEAAVEAKWGKYTGEFPYHLGVPKDPKNHIYLCYTSEKLDFCICDAGVYMGTKTLNGGDSSTVKYQKFPLYAISGGVINAFLDPKGQEILKEAVQLAAGIPYQVLRYDRLCPEAQAACQKGRAAYQAALQAQKDGSAGGGGKV